MSAAATTRTHGKGERPAAVGTALAELRAKVARIENAAPSLVDAPHAAGRANLLPLGLAAADAALGGGWPRAGLAELHAAETRGTGAATGFALALAALLGASRRRPLFWIGTALGFGEAGGLYAPGLLGAGLDPSALVTVGVKRLAEAVWAAEEAARSGLSALTVLEARGNPELLALEGTRRLHLRAQGSGAAFLLLRQGGQAEATAAPLRLRIFAHASAPPGDPALRLLGRPAFRLLVEKAPTRFPAREIVLEWNAHERRFAEPEAVPLLPDARAPLSASVHGPHPAAGAGAGLASRAARGG